MLLRQRMAAQPTGIMSIWFAECVCQCLMTDSFEFLQAYKCCCDPFSHLLIFHLLPLQREHKKLDSYRYFKKLKTETEFSKVRLSTSE